MLLHGSLLFAILAQLFLSGLVERPRDGQAGSAFYEIHRIVGLGTLGIVVAFWLWTVLRRTETPFSALFPWLSSQRRTAVIADLKTHIAQLRRRQLPPADVETPLASAVHGLGLLTALAMAGTGAFLFRQPVPAGIVLEAHQAIANLMWAYVISHAGLAVLHQFTGHAVLQRMFGRASD
jgi:cytochrome b561